MPFVFVVRLDMCSRWKTATVATFQFGNDHTPFLFLTTPFIYSCTSCQFAVDLRLGQNKFSGPLTMLTSLQNLETLHLDENAFSGSIPDFFDYLFRLESLAMQKNQFVSTIPPTLTHLQSLSN